MDALEAAGAGLRALVGVSAYTLDKRRQRFEEDGPAGLQDRESGRRGGSRLPEET